MDASGDYVDCSYAAWGFRRLQELRSGGHLVDVTLCAEGKEIPCHRVVLSACSDYFRAMFCGGLSESNTDKLMIEIGGVSAEALQVLVDFAYSSKIKITSDNVQPLFEAANMLQLERIEHECEKFLSGSLCPETCLGIWALADKVSCTKLSGLARSYALKRFEEVYISKEFLQLPLDFLKMYISDSGLHAKKEERMLEAILLWARHHPQERQEHLKELMEYVIFSHVDQIYLENMLETDEMFAETSGIQDLIRDQSQHATPRLIHQDDILVLGGTTARIYGLYGTFDMYKLDLHFDCVDKTPVPQCLRGCVGTAACVVGNDVIVTGGERSPSNAWRYNSSLNSWMELGHLNEGRFWHGMAALNGQVYVVGGENKDITKKAMLPVVEVYCEMTNSWREMKPLKRGVSQFGITTCCEKVYIFGGTPGAGKTTSAVKYYDPTRNKWTSATSLPKAVKGVNACTIDSKVYLVGGQLERILCYDPLEDCYLEMAVRQGPWDHCSATVCGCEIFITGGCSNADSGDTAPHGHVQCYNVSSDTVSIGVVKDLPVPLCGHNTVTISKH